MGMTVEEIKQEVIDCVGNLDEAFEPIMIHSSKLKILFDEIDRLNN